MIVPISVTIPGVGTVRFPKALQGKEVTDAEWREIKAKYLAPYIAKDAKLVRSVVWLALLLSALSTFACSSPSAPDPCGGIRDSTMIPLVGDTVPVVRVWSCGVTLAK